ncbi:MAG: hypothetical protein M1275_02535 [Patescibacteria group bacterium]|nr:hypothetical protein [Patescibacteria group bacterium]
MSNIVEWFFEKKLNGDLRRGCIDALEILAASKYIDAVLEVGSSNGLTGLAVRDGIAKNFRHHIVEFSGQKERNTKGIFAKAGYSNYKIFTSPDGKLPDTSSQYDLILMHAPDMADKYSELAKTLHDRKVYIMDCFIIVIGEQLPEFYRTFGNIKQYKSLGLWLVKT